MLFQIIVLIFVYDFVITEGVTVVRTARNAVAAHAVADHRTTANHRGIVAHHVAAVALPRDAVAPKAAQTAPPEVAAVSGMATNNSDQEGVMTRTEPVKKSCS